MGWVWVNGRLVPEEQGVVPCGDPGLLYGEGLFETLAVHQGVPAFLERHLERLDAGAAFLGIPSPPFSRWAEALSEVVAANRVQEGWARLVLTPGSGSPLAVAWAGSGRRYPEDDYRRGWRAIISSYRQDHLSPLCRLKTLSFLPHLLARREARQRGADEGLHLNFRGEIAEGAYTNLFLVKGQTLLTPGLESGPLPGITRGVVMELAAATGLEVREGRVTPEDVHRADEAFLTSSLAGIMPLVALEGRPVGEGKPGPVTKKLAAAYAECLDREADRLK